MRWSNWTRIAPILIVSMILGIAIAVERPANQDTPRARVATQTTTADAISEPRTKPLWASENARQDIRTPNAYASPPAPSEPQAERSDSLDQLPLRVAAEHLQRAIAQARKERALRISPGLIDRLVEQGSVEIIVEQPDSGRRFEERLTNTQHQEAHYFQHIPFAALEVGPQALLKLIESADVAGIEQDRIHHPGLHRSVALIGADIAQANGHDGTDQVIAILDTGIESDHPAFEGRIIDEACFSRLGDCPSGGNREFGPGAGAPCTFSCEHGTLVAGPAVGLDPDGVGSGVALDAKAVSIMVYSEYENEPAAFMSDIIAGLEHVYELREFYSFAAVNLSLGGQAFDSEESCDLANTARKAMIDLLRSQGIATIVASGNDGYADRITEPACISTAISVGATNKSDDVSLFSNASSILSVFAPGERIRTTSMGGGFGLASGTSIAAPHVAGAWAAIKEAFPDQGVSEILFALQSTGQPIVDTRNDLTLPRIDVASAISALEAATTADPEEDTTNPEPSTEEPRSSDRCGLLGLEVLVAWGIARLHRSKRS